MKAKNLKGGGEKKTPNCKTIVHLIQHVNKGHMEGATTQCKEKRISVAVAITVVKQISQVVFTIVSSYSRNKLKYLYDKITIQ